MGRASAAFQMIDDRKLFRQILPTCFFIVSVNGRYGSSPLSDRERERHYDRQSSDANKAKAEPEKTSAARLVMAFAICRCC